MRLFTKYFLFGMLVLGLAFSVSGYFLLHYSMESSLAREAEFALKQYQYDKFTVQSALLSYTDVSIILEGEDGYLQEGGGVFAIWSSYDAEAIGDEGLWDNFVKSLFGGLSEKISVPVAFYGEDGTPVYSEIEGLDGAFLDGLTEDTHVYQFRHSEEGSCVLVGSVLNCDKLMSVEGVWSVDKDEDTQGLAGASEGLEGTLTGASEELAGTLTGASEGLEGTLTGASEEVAGTLTGASEGLAGTLTGAPEGLAESAQAQSGISDGLRKIYFVTQWDIGKVILQQQTLRQYFIRCYLIAMAGGMVILGFLSALLTEPLKRMSKAAGRMAEGDYETRLAISGKDEIGELAGSFNRMADAVEEKIGELSRAAREKEDFVANFAHELKTPLTSIIGYADTIYQKELPREEVRRASWHIWNEGMRLESLSFKLMELTVLGRQEFPLVEMPADELLRDVAQGLEPLMEEKRVALSLRAQAAYVKVDYDLLKTLLINLVDNSVKAGAGRIELMGEVKSGAEQAEQNIETREAAGAVRQCKETIEDVYRICVRDDGCGMETEVLSRITEAFYMVDKARSRKQHGAGLGLALAERIARVHGSELSFESRKGEGTEVSFFLKCEKDVEDEEGEN